MPLREFGGRAAGGALGLQSGNVVTDGFGNITVNFPVAFGSVPNVTLAVLDAANNYYPTLRNVNVNGFTAHIRRVGITSTDDDRWDEIADDAFCDMLDTLAMGQPVGSRTIFNDAAGVSSNVHHYRRLMHDHLADAAAGPGITVMWIAVT